MGKLIEEFLREQGATIEAFHEMERAKEALSSQKPDLVISMLKGGIDLYDFIEKSPDKKPQFLLLCNGIELTNDRMRSLWVRIADLDRKGIVVNQAAWGKLLLPRVIQLLSDAGSSA